jgi:branched-subunit amino acid aminotransferase/4-amino-4-deoxychorismate lyase
MALQRKLVLCLGGKAVALPDQDSYLARIEAIRELIRLGEVYIANLTHQLTASTAESAETLYARLRQLNPAPFSAFLRQGHVEILSASPERFIQIRPADIRTSDQQIRDQGPLLPRTITTYPIKGTRPRGDDAVSDAQNALDLLASGKDRSELLMIVDLERNDLSRICLPDSIVVPELFRLETYPTVHHLVATVQGLLRGEISAVDALKACFPGGSITGAPKIAAMRIIDQLELQARYLYTGCLGYFSLDGQSDFNILIRSIIKQGQSVSYGSGGGITWESHAVDEYDEMLVKAKSFRQVMQRIRKGRRLAMLWINGQPSQGQDLILDDGLLFGRGVFETIRVGDQPIFWAEHLLRLNQGLSDLGIRPPVDPDVLLRQVQSLPIRHCVLKIVATAANLILQTRPLPAADHRAWHLAVASGTRTSNPLLLSSKNLNYLDNLLAWENARQAGFDDVIWLNSAGQVAETSRANLFWLRDGQILTPDLACGLLNGVVRQWVIANYPVQAGFFSLDDLLSANAVFITNSLIGIQPISRIQAHRFADVPLIDQIRQHYQDFFIKVYEQAVKG